MLPAPYGGNSRNLPAASNGILKRIHTCAIGLAAAEWQFIGVADSKTVTKIRIDIPSLSVGEIGNLRLPCVSALEAADVVRLRVGGEQS